MGNYNLGIPTIVTAAILYYLSFRAFAANKKTLALFFLLLAGFILRIFTALDPMLHDWDERYHALVAKNLISFPAKPMLYIEPLLDYNYKNWTHNHIWVHKQPVPLYAMALSILTFGTNELAVRLPSILLSTFGIYITYQLGKILFDKGTGYIAAFLFSIHGLIIEQTAGRVATDHYDVFFTIFISWAILVLLKQAKSGSLLNLIGGGVLTGLAILTKWLPALIVIPIWGIAALHYQGIKKGSLSAALLVMCIIVVVVPWQLYIFQYFPKEASWEMEYNALHIFSALEGHGKPWYFHLNTMRIIFGELIYVPIMYLVYVLIKLPQKIEKLLLLVWILIPYVFFSLAKTKMQGYILFCSPAIFISTAYFILHGSLTGPRLLYIKKGIAIGLILLPIRYSIERIKPLEINQELESKLTELALVKNENLPDKSVLFNASYPIEIMFYTNYIAYSHMPSEDELKDILQKGYHIFGINKNQLTNTVENLSKGLNISE